MVNYAINSSNERSPMHLLIIDDNQDLLYALKRLLNDSNYHVDVAENLHIGYKSVSEKKYDLILLDWILPDGNGIDLLKTLREEKITTPILFFSSKNEVEDKVEALDSGADDYLEKPFSNIELLARIRALLRREWNTKQTQLIIERLVIDFTSRCVMMDGNDLKLSAKEFQLLELLLLNTNTVLTRYQISEHLSRDFDHITSSNIVDAHIKNLRKKLDPMDLIQTVRGVGYMIKQ